MKTEIKRYKIRIKKDDTVMIRSGKNKGRTGKVLMVHPTTNQVTVEGINIVKKHVKPSKNNPQGGILDFTKPIHISKVGIIEPTSKKPTKIGYALDKNGVKTRIYKKTGKEIK